MAKILEMQEQRRQLVARRGFESWQRRFSTPFDASTTPADLSDGALGYLIEGGEGPSMALYELIMGFLGLGKGPRFYSLETRDIITVTDITLFIMDQLRFEAMRRLRWIDDWPILHIPLMDMVEQYSARFSERRHHTPPLSENHILFQEYHSTFPGDQAVFVRRLIPDAIKVFQEMGESC